MVFSPQGLIVLLIVGAIAGWGAAKIMRGHSFGLLYNIIIGVIGAIIGNFVLSFWGQGAFYYGLNAGINWWIYAIVVALAGACLLLYLIPHLRKIFNK
ncbi:membrane protein [Planctomycetales bacterium]|nr:membrane protein [Planctomycetales bacterium]GHT00675.1 membrane protein [Planctomycetales bacterium]GHT07966.1 membrane protein [Planctomycetales bacterium]